MRKYHPQLWRAVPITALAALMMIVQSGFTPAYAADNGELTDLVRQQAQMMQKQANQIEQLQQRLDALESERVSAQPSATASGTARAAAVDEQLQDLQRNVALIEATQASGSAIDWSDGAPTFASADGERTLDISGRLQFDYSNTFGSKYTDDRDIDGFEARRLRLAFGGQLARRLNYKLQLEFAGDDANVLAAYLNTGFEVGGNDLELYLGSKFNDRSMSGSTSSNKTWFMERNLVANAITPDRGSYGLGLTAKLYDGHRDWHASLSVTNGEIGRDNDSSSNTTFMSRAHWNPWRSGDDMIHLGAWGFYEDFNKSDGSVYKNIDIASHFNENTTIRGRKLSDPKYSVGYGLEIGTSLGSFAAFAEYGQRTIKQRDDEGSERLTYDAYAVNVGYFLTGEQHEYSSKSGVWLFPDVRQPVGAGGIGAFELAARYQALDLYDPPDYPGGNGHSTTLGLNWYPNDWSRIMLNWIRWYTNNRSGDYEGPDDGNTIAIRAQVMF